MFKIKAIYKGEPKFGMYDCYEKDKEYSFLLLDSYKPFEQYELQSKNKKQTTYFYYSWNSIIEEWDITDINTELMTEHDLIIHHPVWKDMVIYLRDRKIEKILNE